MAGDEPDNLSSNQPSEMDLASAFFVEAFAPEHRVDPYPLYRRMRELGPFASTEFNMHLAFGHAACSALVRHPAASSDERRGVLFQREAATDARLQQLQAKQPPLVFLDPPDHTRLRTLVAAGFSPRRIQSLRGDIETMTAALLDDLADAGSEPVDVIERFAYPLPIAVICRLLGIPVADQHRFRRWSVALTRSVDPAVLRTPDDELAMELATVEMNAYITDLLDERRRHPGDDLLTVLLGARDEAGGLTTEELLDLASLLLVAGHETTVNLIGNGLCALLAAPDQLADWHAHPALADNAVDELLRFDSPLQMVQRIAGDGLQIEGVQLPPGDQVIVMLGAANRDPAVFDRPDELDLRRANANRQLSFGGGVHHCLGSALARVEGAVALGGLVERFPHMAMAGEPTMRDTFNLRGREHLLVALRG